MGNTELSSLGNFEVEESKLKLSNLLMYMFIQLAYSSCLSSTRRRAGRNWGPWPKRHVAHKEGIGRSGLTTK